MSLQTATLPMASTTQRKQLDVTFPIYSASSIVDFAAITNMTGNTKRKTFRIDEGLLETTEWLRGKTGLDFSAYMREALIFFNRVTASAEQEEQLNIFSPAALTPMTGNTKHKTLSIDEGLISMTEKLRRKAGLDFSAYIRQALIVFNEAFTQYLRQEDRVSSPI